MGQIDQEPVGNARVGAPAIFGEKEDEREARYADFLPRMVEALFPTAVLTHRLAEIDESEFAPTLTVFAEQSRFRVSDDARPRVSSRPSGRDSRATAIATVNQLHAVQRMMNIAPHFNKAKIVAMIAGGIDSAFKIRRMGPAQFVRTSG